MGRTALRSSGAKKSAMLTSSSIVTTPLWLRHSWELSAQPLEGPIQAEMRRGDARFGPDLVGIRGELVGGYGRRVRWSRRPAFSDAGSPGYVDLPLSPDPPLILPLELC